MKNTYPSSSKRKKDWNKVDKEVDEEYEGVGMNCGENDQ